MINIVTALHCEAKPIIEHYNLKKMTYVDVPFAVFVNQNKNIHLIISGVGKIKIAVATTFLYGLTNSKPHSCFLNVGIAGSSQYSIGESIVAHKIVEKSTNRSWYPFVSQLKQDKQAVLFTHDSPQTIYPATGMVDMEGSAFFQAAASFVSQEQIQVLKVISDNNLISQQNINENKIKELMLMNLANITEVINYLIFVGQQEHAIGSIDNGLKEFQSKWHFTHAQSIQLKEYLRRWKFQILNQNPLAFCAHEKSATQVINQLIKKLDINENSLC